MQRHSRTLAALALVLVAPLAAGLPPSSAAAAPLRDVTVTGEVVGTYPAYDALTDRFAVRTNGGTRGTITVTASTTDPDGSVMIDGRPVENGAETVVDGLDPGDEVNVQITDATGSTNQSFLYLPAGFPRIDSGQSGTGPDEGLVFLGLASYLSETAYETAVDPRGVPVRVSTAPKAHDFKPSGLGDGRYTVARLLPGSNNEDAGYEINELGPRFGVVERHTLVPVKGSRIRADDTDFHDVQLLPDGRVILVGYQRYRRTSGKTWLDAVIQVVGKRGKPQFTWTSRGRVKPKEAYVLGSRGQDYAHVNSVQMQRNGDIVASFRNTGQVLRIATRKHHGHRPGDIVWRIGGERNEFTFLGDPLGGFCAQHDARILPGGHLLLFDNGAQKVDDGPLNPQTADMCPDPADPGGDRVARPQSRVVEYDLDVAARTATLRWSHQVPGRYAAFAGSSQRLPSGHTLVGWWNAQDLTAPETAVPLVTEVDAAGTPVWSLTAQGWFSYRAHKGPAPDRIPPAVAVAGLADGATLEEGQQVLVDVTCTDRGGSNLATCTTTQPNRAPLDTSPGTHSLGVTATDRAGNTQQRTLTYTVR